MAKLVAPPTEDSLLFEVAWEVCNQIGGIYTVIKTKAPAMVERWGEQYFLVGPYNQATATVEFEECSPPPFLLKTLNGMREKGIPIFFGRWLIPGRPFTILINHKARTPLLDSDKYLLWKDHGISCNNTHQDENETISFGFALTEFFSLLTHYAPHQSILAHFHEWMSSVALPRIRHLNIPVRTVFTTHATLLGRYIASDNPSFYSELKGIDPFQASRYYNVGARFEIERSSVHSAHVFTTISDITGIEADHLLGRKPEFILPNGINVERFAALHEFQNLHLRYKERIHEFVMGHFFPSYSFDLDRTLYLFTSGRYEYRNKGMDLFIEAIYRLNGLLKQLPNPPNIVAFLVTKAATKNVSVSAIQNHLVFEDLKNTCREIERSLGDKLLTSIAQGTIPNLDTLLPKDSQVKLKRILHARARSTPPPIVTHDMVQDRDDAILQHLRHRGMFNDRSDPVKVVFHPDFITATSPLFNMDYDQFVRGCHLGVFPSYYEPWGYTPLECIALGLPTVTTDLSGFGGYVEKHVSDAKDNGIFVLNRSKQSTDRSIEDLTQYLYKFVQLSRRDRIELRNRAERLSEKFDWSALAKHYHEAHDRVSSVLPSKA